MTPYITVPFKFSDRAYQFLQAIIEPLIVEWEKSDLPGSLVNFSNEAGNAIKNSIVWEEVLSFANRYNLPVPFNQLFYTKANLTYRGHIGNPHIDTTGGDYGIEKDVPFRFNILLNGEKDTEMLWWNADRHSPNVEIFEMTTYTGKKAGRLQAKGRNRSEQIANIQPIYSRCNSLVEPQQYSSFVRTDIIHALLPKLKTMRIVYSLRWTEVTWDELESKIPLSDRLTINPR